MKKIREMNYMLQV